MEEDKRIIRGTHMFGLKQHFPLFKENAHRNGPAKDEYSRSVAERATE